MPPYTKSLRVTPRRLFICGDSRQAYLEVGFPWRHGVDECIIYMRLKCVWWFVWILLPAPQREAAGPPRATRPRKCANEVQAQSLHTD